MTPTFLLTTVAAPLAVAGTLVAAAFFTTRRSARPGPRAWAGALALSLAFALGAPFILNQVPEWPPSQAADWLPFLAAAALVLGLADLLLPRRLWASIVVLALLLGFAAAAYFGPLASAAQRLMGEGSAKSAWVAAVFAAVALPAMAARAGAARTPNAGPPFALGLLTACTIAAALIAETAKYAQFASLLGLGLAPVGVAALLLRPWPADRGLVTVFSALNACLWLLLHFYAEVPTSAALIGAAAPAVLLLSWFPILRSSAKAAGFAQVLAAVAMGLAAVGLTLAAKPPADSAYPMGQ